TPIGVLGSAVLVENRQPLGRSDLVPVHLVFTPLAPRLDFMPALHVREGGQQVVDLVAVLVDRPRLGADRFPPGRSGITAVELDDGRTNGSGVDHVGGKAESLNGVEVGIVLGTSLGI